MKKLIIPAILAILIFVVFLQWDANRNLRHSLNNFREPIPDTVYVDKPIKVPPEYIDREVPKEVIVYRDKVVKIDSIIYRDKVVYIQVDYDSTKTITYPEQFLTLYPGANKLLFINLNKGNLDIGSLRASDGNTFEQQYRINTERYNYRYVNGELTTKPKNFFSKVKLVGEYQMRPIQNFHDINFGLKYNTSKINYELGINGHYYQIPNYGFGYGPYLKLKLEF